MPVLEVNDLKKVYTTRFGVSLFGRRRFIFLLCSSQKDIERE